MNHPRNNKSNSDNNETKAFRAWLETLTWQQLEDAMVFTVDNNNSDDTLLLTQLVKQHRPLPTPLHPRSVPRPYASAGFPEYTSRYRPATRLLKLVPKTTTAVQHVDDPLLRQLLLSEQQQPQQPHRYSVLARHFPQPDGTYLSVPPLQMLRDADEALEQCTILVVDNDHTSVRLVARAMGPNPHCTSGETGTSDISTSHNPTTQRLLSLLRIVSRGQFGTMVVPVSSTFNNNPPWPPWLQPTQDWFTLSTYLVARYEMSLWKAFRSQKNTATKEELPNVCQNNDAWAAMAVQKALSLTLKLEAQSLLAKGHFRDSTLHQLFSLMPLHNILKQTSLWHTPIAQLGLPLDKLRRTAQTFLRQIVADQAMETLLRQQQQQEDEILVTTKQVTRGKKKKRGRHGKQHERTNNTTASSRHPSSDEEAPSEMTSEEDAFDEEPLDFSLMLRNKRTPARIVSSRVPPTASLSLMEDDQTSSVVVSGADGVANKSSPEAVAAVSAILDNVIEKVLLQVGVSQDDSGGEFQTVGRGGGKAKAPTLVRKVLPTSQTILDPKHLPRPPPSRPSPPPSTAATTTTASKVLGQKQNEPKPLLVVPDAPLHPQRETFYPFEAFSDPFFPDPNATIRTSNTEGSPSYGALDHEFFQQPDGERQEHLDWGRLRGFTSRDESILAEFFVDQEKEETKDVGIASSTAASLASSTGDDDSDAEIVTMGEEAKLEGISSDIDETFDDDAKRDTVEERLGSSEPCLGAGRAALSKAPREKNTSALTTSPSPEICPSIPPIQVSLSDISQMQKKARKDRRSEGSQCSEPSKATSVSPTRRQAEPKKIVTSLSRDNLRTSLSEDYDGQRPRKKSLSSLDTGISYSVAAGRASKTRDDDDLRAKAATRRSSGAAASYRNVAISPGLAKCRDDNDLRLRPRETPPRLSSYRSVTGRPHVFLTSKSTLSDSPSKRSSQHFEFESVPQDFRYAEEQYRDKASRVQDKPEMKEEVSLREERDSYRDMCLNLGAEVASLRSQLAVQKACQMRQPMASIGMPQGNGYQYHHRHGAPTADNMSTHTYHVAPRARTLAAMSDAGYRGEHDSLASEDEIVAKVITTKNPRQISSAVTVTESEASLDQNNGHNPGQLQVPLELTTVAAIPDLAYLNGTQSRLAKDIYHFIESTNEQLNKLSRKKLLAVERMTRLVETVWPRAQVKLYGSHATGLCVPGSDLDFVVCLPRVHTYEVADAPGALEGRNAINETSQKQLARRLKGESWIDPGSMKLIERTFVPVIKVATKDTRAKTIHLDISFYFPGHHGLEAVNMIKSLCGEIPSLRSLVIILKRFLIDRGLLEAYSGEQNPVLSPVPPTWCAVLAFSFLHSSDRWAEFLLLIPDDCSLLARSRARPRHWISAHGVFGFLRQLF